MTSVLELPCPLTERVQAFSGMISILHKNPDVLLNNKTNIYSFLLCCIAWPELPPENIRTGLSQIMRAVRANNPPLWDKVIAKFAISYPVPRLMQMYQLEQ